MRYVVSLLVAILCATVWGVYGDQCAAHANGCSIPFDWPFFYKTRFTPACNRHDICYRCGADYELNKSVCDSAFLHDMTALCDTRRRRRHPRASKRGVVCRTVALDAYYFAVHLFGSFHFHNAGDTESYCSQSWVRSCLP